MYYFFVVLSLVVGFSIYMMTVRKFIHMLQLEGYKNREFFHWLRQNMLTSVVLPAGVFVPVLLVFFVSKLFIQPEIYGWGFMLLIFATAGIAYIYPYIRKKFKKPLVFTHRLLRLFLINILVAVLETYLFLSLFLQDVYLAERIVIWFAFAILIAPLNMVLSNLIIFPVEKIIHKHYIDSAAKKLLSMDKLIRIGITGSYGKTSTKFILAAILSEKFNVLVTPDSYNTTMGTTKVIREMLNQKHEVFISEMGARNIGDIAEICRIVRPGIGILTSIGKQHLETFKTLDNIIKTKNELIQGLTQDGTGFFPSDNQYCYELFQQADRNKILYGIENHLEQVRFTIKELSLSEKGSTFTLMDREGTSVQCTTKLLGKHNVLNILGCSAVAKHLGLSMEEIAAGIAKVEPIPHRLQIIPTGNGTVVIDDAFNSNPVGAKMALDVLGQFKGRKIIVTPGMVELGKEEYSLNKDFGKSMAGVADVAILVGRKRTQAIQDGLKEKGFSSGNMHVANHLDEATTMLAAMVKAGDVILFENDLPDNYDE